LNTSTTIGHTVRTIKQTRNRKNKKIAKLGTHKQRFGQEDKQNSGKPSEGQVSVIIRGGDHTSDIQLIAQNVIIQPRVGKHPADIQLIGTKCVNHRVDIQLINTKKSLIQPRVGQVN